MLTRRCAELLGLLCEVGKPLVKLLVRSDLTGVRYICELALLLLLCSGC